MRASDLFRAEAYLIAALMDGALPIDSVVTHAARNRISVPTLRSAARALTRTTKCASTGVRLWELDEVVVDNWRADFEEIVRIGRQAMPRGEKHD